MKKILLLTIMIFGFLTPAARADTEKTRAIIEAVFEAFNRHDLEAVVALYHPEAKLVTPGFPEPRYGLDVIRATYKDHFDNIPGVYDEVTRIVADGDQAAVEFTATWAQPTEDDPEARGALKIATFLTIKDGLIIEDMTYFDRMVFEPVKSE
ncbi:MAG: nuclear transport factor 2 family protein [Alphaproteobacteria bacterium]